MLPFRKRLSLYIVIAFLTVFIGFVAGYFLFPTPATGNNAEPAQNGLVNGNGDSEEDKEFNSVGYIQARESVVYEQGTHELYDAEGNLIAALINNKRLLDLKFFENRFVEVAGTIEDSLEGEPPLIWVKKVTVR